MSGEDLQKLMSAVSLSKEEIEIWYYYDGTTYLSQLRKEVKRLETYKKIHMSLLWSILWKVNPEDISYHNAKAVIVNGKAEIREDDNGSFVKKMYER